MALKDWIRIERVWPEWHKKEDKIGAFDVEKIWIFQNKKLNNYKDYTVYLSGISRGPFKTKSEAIQFAKKYMETH
jgi:hypothetical protein